jgi:hypothetical protein
MKRYLPAAALLLVSIAAPPAAAAQQQGPPAEIGVMVGASRYELSPTGFGGSTGTGFSFNAGVTLALVRRVVLLEPSLGYATVTTEFGKHTSWIFPELTAQVQRTYGRVRPYVGAGIGTGTQGLTGPTHWKFTLLGLGGVRVHVGGLWGVRAEVRLRSVDPWSGHTAGLGVGFTRSSF